MKFIGKPLTDKETEFIMSIPDDFGDGMSYPKGELGIKNLKDISVDDTRNADFRRCGKADQIRRKGAR